jgi:hypothetical protein
MMFLRSLVLAFLAITPLAVATGERELLSKVSVDSAAKDCDNERHRKALTDSTP